MPFRVHQFDKGSLYFGSLTEAVREARDGDAIEVQLRGRHPFEPIDLGKKDLILRAGVGYDPIFEVQETASAAISSRGRLWLEGLAFERSSAEGVGFPLVSSSGDYLWINNCRMAIDQRGEASFPPPACIESIDCRDFLLLNSTVLSRHFSVVTSRNSRSIASRQGMEIRNCALLGQWALTFDQPERSRSDVVFQGNLSIGRVAFSSVNRHRIIHSRFDVTQNVFDTRQTLISISKAFSEQKRPDFAWTGRQNIFSEGAGYVEGFNGTRRVSGIDRLEIWKAFVEESGSVEARVVRRDLAALASDLPLAELKLDEMVEGLTQDRDLPDAGPDPETVGPGENWHRWARSSEGLAWREAQDLMWQRSLSEVD